MRKFILLFLLLDFISNQSIAQRPYWFTSDYELSSSLINEVMCDSKGFVWVATEDGLNRFDGSKFITYRHNPEDSTSLASNFVFTLFEDKDGNILVGTYAGVQIYNPVRDQFTTLTKEQSQLPQNLSISDIEQLSDGRLVVSGFGLKQVKADPATGLQFEKNLLTIDEGTIDKMIVDYRSNLWMIHSTGDILRLDIDGTEHRYELSAGYGEAKVIAQGSDHNVYVGTKSKGLWRFDDQRGGFESVGDFRLSSSISAIIALDDNFMMIGTDGSGYMLYDLINDRFTEPSYSYPGFDKLKIHAIDSDSDGNLWVGIYQKGVIAVPIRGNSFKTLGQRGIDPSLLGNACITAILKDRSGKLWVGTDNDGIYCVDSAMENSTHYFGKGLPAIITGLYQDKKGELWVMSYDKGFGRMDPKSGAYMREPLNDNGIPVEKVFDVDEDRDGNMIIATMGSGLFMKSPGMPAQKIQTDDSFNPWINDFEFGPNGKDLYIATYNGLYSYVSGTMERLGESSIVTSVYCDLNGTIWAGMVGGLAKVTPDGTMEKYTLANGLPSGMVHAVEGDGRNVWISTNSGLCSFDPAQSEFVVYTVNDGLQGNEFYKNSSFRDDEGNLYFGGLNGLTYFNPQELRDRIAHATIRITDFYIGSDRVKGYSRSNGRLVTDKPVYDTDVFYLGAGEDSFSLDFALEEIFGHGAARFEYSIDNEPWQTLPRQLQSNLGGSRLTFNHMVPGKHVVGIRAVEKGSVLATKNLTIDIAYHWYQTWWAKVIYLILALSVIGFIWYRYRQHQKSKEMAAEMARKDEINEAKLQFFTNVSHEIKTPMTLVMSPIEQLMVEDEDPGRQRTYGMVLRNCKRIMRLVNEIMDLRKIDNQQFQIQYSKVDLICFIEDLCAVFDPVAEKKDIYFTFTHKGFDNVYADIDKTNLDKVVMNLLSNAIKYTPAGGEVNINLALQRRKDEAWVEISVTDTGIGIPEEERSHIFERFYRVANNATAGTGIGLHLAYKIMELHGGELSLEDNPAGQGSRFIAAFPAIAKNQKEVAYEAQVIEPVVESGDVDVFVPDQEEGEGKNSYRLPLLYVVEDDEEIGTYLAASLASTFRVERFVNGALAMEAIHKQVPDLLITDIMMPVMDGLTLVKKIRDNINYNHIPIVALTAKSSENDEIECYDHGVDAYVPKPFNIRVLQKKLCSLIDSRQRLRNVYSGKQNQVDQVTIEVPQSHDDQLLSRLMKVVNAHISNSDMTIEEIAQEVGISRVHLHRKLKELTNQTSRDFIRNLRLQKAAEIMRQTQINVSEVSNMVGFKNANNFATSFKAMYGQSPSEYMEQYSK